MTSKEAMILGGLDFEVGIKPCNIIKDNAIEYKASEGGIFYHDHDIVDVPNAYATYRKDTQHIFGVVGNRYEVIQNTEAFAFFDSIIGEGHAEYETVGALGNGERVFITAKLPEGMHVNKELIDQYLLLSMAHDGSGAIVVMFTPIRVVCNNTLTLALDRRSKTKVSIRHTKNALNRLDEAKKILGIASKTFSDMEEYFNVMAKRRVEDDDLSLLLEKSFDMPRQEDESLSTRSKNKLNEVLNYYYTGFGQKDIIGTQWGVYNAVTGYLQNVAMRDDETQFSRSFIKGDEDIRQRTNMVLNKYYNEGREVLEHL